MIGRHFFLVAAIAAAWCSIAFAAPEIRRVERGNLILENVPDTPATLRDRLRMYQAARGAGLMDFAPDGRGILVQTRFGETGQLHRVDAPNAMRRQITFYDEPVNSAIYRPGKWPKRTILFSRDTGGDEMFQLYLLDERSGDVVRLSDGKTRNTDAVFSRDGKLVAWTSVPADSARYRVMVAEVSDPKTAHVVLEEDGSWSAANFSPDNQTLAVTREISVSDQQIWLLDLINARKAQLEPSPEKIYRGAPIYSPDGQALFYVSDEDSEFRRVVRHDLRTDDKDFLTRDIPWDVEALEMSPNGRMLAFAVNEGGTSQIYFLDARRGRASPGPKMLPGVVERLKFNADGRRLGFWPGMRPGIA